MGEQVLTLVMKVQKHLKIHYSYFNSVENSFIDCNNHLLAIFLSSDVTTVQTNKWMWKVQLCVIKHRHCPLPLPPFPLPFSGFAFLLGHLQFYYSICH